MSLFIFFGQAQANMEIYEKNITTLEKQFQEIRQKKVAEKGSAADIKNALNDLNAMKLKVSDFINILNRELSRNEQSKMTLGTAISGEPAEVTQKRRELDKDKNILESGKSKLNLLSLQIDESIQALNETQKSQLATHLFSRGDTIYTVVRKNLSIDYAATFTRFSDLVFKKSGIHSLTTVEYVSLSIVLILVILFSYRGRKSLYSKSRSHLDTKRFTNQLYGNFLSNLARILPYILTSTAIALFVHFMRQDRTSAFVISYIVYALPVYFLVTLLIRTLFSSRYSDYRLFNIPNETAASLCRRLHVLLILALCSYVFFSTLISHDLPKDFILLARSLFLALLVVNLVWLVWILRKIPGLKIAAILPVLVSAVLGMGLSADLLGYRNLAEGIFRATLGISFASGLFILFNRLLNDFFDGINHGQLNWQSKLRASLGNDQDQIPGLVWVRITANVFIWCVLAWSILNILGLSDQALQKVYLGIVEGFTIGSINVIPSRVLLALLVFAVLYLLSSWLRVKLDEQWLMKSGIERGSREAMVTISWYVAISIAFLLSISIAGVTFTNLTIIAGALSVGIGFGLQNIVNNFVSGLILLFERPVKRGDWVVVGNTEGYVKNIRIRSTQIQTFDKADVIVPNSDLISNQVTNWMLYDNAGRIRIPVGVAYGSDTGKVKSVLETVGAAHDQVITNVAKLEPKVLFMSFGESSLDFELRCHIRNIDARFQVTSDLNFAIDKAFREANIEIAFPQRDIHIKNDANQKPDNTNNPDPDQT